MLLIIAGPGPCRLYRRISAGTRSELLMLFGRIILAIAIISAGLGRIAITRQWYPQNESERCPA
jgi:hypothetical protein